jgi:hypothetical protein
MFHVGDSIIVTRTMLYGVIVGQYEDMFLVRHDNGLQQWYVAGALRKV